MNDVKRRRTIWLAIGMCLVIAAVMLRHPLLTWFSVANMQTGGAPESSERALATSGIDHYTCSMHPSVKQQRPGKCPICSMDLVPVTSEQQRQGVVTIDAARRQLIGVRTGRVSVAPLRRTLRAIGQVTYDESTLSEVNLRVRGWVTKLFVNTTGQRVRVGQPLLQLYSPELYNAQQDFLLALSAGQASLTRAGEERLHLLGLNSAQIAAIAQSHRAAENITISAPTAGFVIEKNVVEGASVDPGSRLYRIAALDEVWVEAEIYERDLPYVHVGQTVDVTLDYVPGHNYPSTIAYVYPFLAANARTSRIRVRLENRDLALRPGMYASVSLVLDAEPRMQVPASAVIYTGPRRLVFVDLGDGRFRPQEVTVGEQSDGMIEIASGLAAGDSIATSGVFLIAAEARISAATTYWDATATAPVAEPAETLMQPASPQPSVKRMHTPAHPAQAKPQPDDTVTYSCPMHPEVQSTTPGHCPKCGMQLAPTHAGSTR
jgi:membrane fusion protein, copper/silver efflux system